VKKTTNALIILDGYGLSDKTEGNAIKKAHTPYLDSLFKKYPHSRLKASGADVGLPKGQMGNSEVGHLNLGAGRIVYQDISMIDNQIETGEFFKNSAFLNAMKNAQNKTLHLIGLCSNGGVHSSLNHLYALLKMAKVQGVTNVCVHCITDGRDTAPASALGFITQIELEIKKIGVGAIASVCGRYNIMDRDNRWERVQKGYNAVADGVGSRFKSGAEAIENSYRAEVFDEFIEPCVIGDYEGIKNGDSAIFFNFRADRARQITRAIADKDFKEFKRGEGFKAPHYVCMTRYDEGFSTWGNLSVAFAPKSIDNTLGEWLAKKGYTQSRIAETEKYAHVTFFFDGGIESEKTGETRVLIDSPKVATYDKEPKMSAFEVAQKAAERINKDDVLIINFANCDMVGHTGDFAATVEAVEEVDMVLEGLVESVASEGGFCLVVSDHGNAECMIDEDGGVMTAHTVGDVPLVLVGDDKRASGVSLKDGRLCDVAPSFLKLMGIDIPVDMTGDVLVVEGGE